jgi:glycerol-3-phosphate dehydrogenase
VVFGVRHEHCRRLSDVMRRRTLLGASADQGWQAAAPAARLMAAELGWSAAEEAEQVEHYRREIAGSHPFGGQV